MVRLSYYGHSAFLLDDGKSRLLFDPFLTGNPLASIAAGDVRCDYILVSHAHGDHLGDAASIAKRTGAALIAIPEVIGLVAGTVGEINSFPMNLGGTVKLPFGHVRMVRADHSSGVVGGISCGFVVHIGGVNVYYAGDTAFFGDMKLIGERDEINWALLPIGDNYTMGPEDATRAAVLLGARNVVPLHYNTWPVIAQEAEGFKALAEKETEAKVHIVKPGEGLTLA